jgi:FKBP-type peptidyl-prolyl cis-trans isomerase
MTFASLRFALATLILVSFCACDMNSQQRVRLKTKQDSVSYAIGILNGKQLKQQEADIDVNMMTAGMKDVMASGGKPQLNEAQIQTLLQQFQAELGQKQQAKLAKVGEANKKRGEEFLAANKTKEGVITTASGLQYKVLVSGKEGGAKPSTTSTVKVHYKGTLLDGTEFDSSYKRGEKAEFPLNGVIPGWTEGVQLMKVGDKFQFFIPSNLAYGLNAAPIIGPNQVLTFEIELFEVKDAPAAAPTEGK